MRNIYLIFSFSFLYSIVFSQNKIPLESLGYNYSSFYPTDIDKLHVNKKITIRDYQHFEMTHRDFIQVENDGTFNTPKNVLVYNTKEVYETNEKGLIVSWKRYDEYDDNWQIKNYTYNTHGNLETVTEKYKEEETWITTLIKCKSKYDSNGNQIEYMEGLGRSESSFLHNGLYMEYLVVGSYSNNERLIETKEYSGYGAVEKDLLDVYSYTYDSNGNMNKRSTYDNIFGNTIEYYNHDQKNNKVEFISKTNDIKKYHSTYKYNNFGDEIQYNNLLEDTQINYSYEYDNNGNWIKRIWSMDGEVKGATSVKIESRF
jgi:hypothetical protein